MRLPLLDDRHASLKWTRTDHGLACARLDLGRHWHKLGKEAAAGVLDAVRRKALDREAVAAELRVDEQVQWLRRFVHIGVVLHVNKRRCVPQVGAGRVPERVERELR